VIATVGGLEDLSSARELIDMLRAVPKAQAERTPRAVSVR
jgi:hypothetical protein